MEADLNTVLSNVLIAEAISKYLTPRDIISFRSVNRAWIESFQKPFHKKVPIQLDELTILPFTTNHSPTSLNWMQNERFVITVLLMSEPLAAAVTEFTETFSAQVKSLELCAYGEYGSIEFLNAVLEPLRHTLEDLKLRMQIPKNVRQGLGDFDAPPPDPEIDRSVMHKLRSLALFPVLGKEVQTNCSVSEVKYIIPPVTPTSCPNLEKLKIVGQIGLQTLFIKDSGLEHLHSLELWGCCETVLKDLRIANLSTPLKRLKLAPAFEQTSEDYSVPDHINRVLISLAKNLESFEIRFKLMQILKNQQLIPLVLPRMPRLKFLCVDMYIENNWVGFPGSRWQELPLQFVDNAVILRYAFPSLEGIVLKSRLERSTLADVFLSREQRAHPHSELKYFQLERLEGDETTAILEREAQEAFPFAKIDIKIVTIPASENMPLNPPFRMHRLPCNPDFLRDLSFQNLL